VDSVRNLLLGGMHTAFIMSLDYLENTNIQKHTISTDGQKV